MECHGGMQSSHMWDAPEGVHLTALVQRRCKPCAGGVEPLSGLRLARLLPQAPGWSLGADGRCLVRKFRFRHFSETMAFVNVLAWIASRQGHHPDFRAGYDYCEVRFTTHAIGGLSENDFICAARLNAVVDH